MAVFVGQAAEEKIVSVLDCVTCVLQVLAVFVGQAGEPGKPQKSVPTNFAVWTRDTKVGFSL